MKGLLLKELFIVVKEKEKTSASLAEASLMEFFGFFCKSISEFEYIYVILLCYVISFLFTFPQWLYFQ